MRWPIQVWTAYAHRAGAYQSGVLLTLVYLVILGPAALIGRRFGARLLDLSAGTASTWIVRPAPEKDLGALRRQF